MFVQTYKNECVHVFSCMLNWPTVSEEDFSGSGSWFQLVGPNAEKDLVT